MKTSSKKFYQKWWFWVLLVVIGAQFYDDQNTESSNSNDNEKICFTCYKKYNVENGWCYDIGGIGTRNCSGDKSFCSYSCDSKRGKENIPKNWQRQYN